MIAVQQLSLKLAYLQLAAAAAARGMWPLFVRPAAVDPYWSAAIVFSALALVASPLLLGASVRRPESGGPRKNFEWLLVVSLGVFAAGSTVMYFAALMAASVAVAVLFHCFAPVIVAVAAPFILGTPWRGRMIVLALAAAAGLALVLQPWRMGASGSSVGLPLIGAAWGAGAAVFNSGYLLVNKRLGTRFSLQERLVYHAWVAAPLLFVAAIWLGGPPPALADAATLATGGATVGVAGGLLFLRGLQHASAESAGILMLLEPLTALLLARLVWGERLGGMGWLGVAVVVASGLLALREPRKDAQGGLSYRRAAVRGVVRRRTPR